MPSAPEPNPAATDEQDLARLARETAYDRYIQAVLIKPQALRTDFLVLAAFHGEIARIPLLVREPMMGEIRLQWWHDVVAATEFMTADAAPNFASPLANHVARLIARFPNTRPAFLAVIEARRAELDAHAFENVTDFETYLDGVGGALLGVGVEVLGVKIDTTVKDALNLAGRGVGAVDLALRLPRLANLARSPKLPIQQWQSRTGQTAPALTSVPENQSADDQAIDFLAEQARASLNAYRALQPDITIPLIGALLPLALVEPYFKALQKERSGQHRRDNPKSPLARLLILWWAAKRKRI